MKYMISKIHGKDCQKKIHGKKRTAEASQRNYENHIN